MPSGSLIYGEFLSELHYSKGLIFYFRVGELESSTKLSFSKFLFYGEVLLTPVSERNESFSF